VNLGTLLFPLIFSFEKRIAYVKSWKYLFPSLFLTAILFLVWDYFFAAQGVWGFNPDYITGLYFFNLPVEEILFFFTVPFSSIFIYMFLNSFWPNAGVFQKHSKHITFFILILAILLAIFNFNKAYTLLNCFYAIILLSLQLFFVKGDYMGRFYRFYLVHLIPFFIVNGILTGTGLQDAVVWYNNDENIGIRLGTIPAEDLLYSMSLMLMNISLFEYFKQHAFKTRYQTSLK
jgi:lycopene cyclase domain-containing protein